MPSDDHDPEIRRLLEQLVAGDPTRSERAGESLADRLGDEGGIEGELGSVLSESAPTVGEDIDRVTVAATGMAWLGGGVPSVDRILVDAISDARREILATSYSMSFGSRQVLEGIAEAAESGIRVALVVNDIDDQPLEIRNYLRELRAGNPDSVDIHDFDTPDAMGSLHAKLVVVDRMVAVVGSSNLTYRGLVASHEFAVRVEGPTAARVAQQIEALSNSRYSTSWLEPDSQ